MACWSPVHWMIDGLAVGATYDVNATSPAQTAYIDDETPPCGPL